MDDFLLRWPCPLALGSSILLSLGAPSSGWITYLFKTSFEYHYLYENFLLYFIGIHLLFSFSLIPTIPPVNLVKIYLETKCFSPTPLLVWATLIFFLNYSQCLPCWSLCFHLWSTEFLLHLTARILLKYKSDHITISNLHGGFLSPIRENWSPYSGNKP